MIAAVFRPRRNRVTLFLMRWWRPAALDLSLEEARGLHTALGDALELAGMRDDPTAWAEAHQ